MPTFHLSLDVPDIDEAVAFYRLLFGIEPVKRHSDYAKFELADPPVAFALHEAPSARLGHLGIRVDSPETVAAASARLAADGLETTDSREETCCYARQDKVWVRDPAGVPWEVYAVLEDVESGAESASCCTPGSGCCAA